VHPRLEERLVGVDVPDAGDDGLIEEQRLDRDATPARSREERKDDRKTRFTLYAYQGGSVKNYLQTNSFVFNFALFASLREK